MKGLVVAALAGLVSGGLALQAAPSAAVTDGGSSPEAPLFGYNDDWSHAGKLPLAASGGAEVIRSVVSWQVVEPRPGEFSWQRYDEFYERILAAGARPLWVLADAPCWAWTQRPRHCRKRLRLARPPSPEHDARWAQFAGLLAERYPRAVAIESWNEPNLANFWRPRPQPQRAAELTAWANFGVKVMASEVPVLLGGLSPLEENLPEQGEMAYDTFIRRAYRATGPGHWDGVAMHPFPSFRAGDDYLKEITGQLDTVRGALADSGAAGAPIWITETGLSTAGPQPYTHREQAEGLSRIYETLAAMPDVPAIIVHRLVDLPKKLRTAESGWGVIRQNGRPKAAFCALAQVLEKPC